MRQNPKVVVITGASAGVGRAAAREFAGKKMRIGLIARDAERLAKTKLEVEGLGGKGLVISADVADPEQVFGAAERIEQELGPIDVWVNNAMTTVFSPLIQIPADEYKRATEVTYLGTVYGTMAALKYMVPRNHGTIIQVGSALAYRSIPLQAPYCGAKSAIRGFTDTLRCELIHDKSKIHITMVHLPALNTPQFVWCKSRLPRHPQPVPPIFQPEVAAKAVVWSAYHKRRELFVARSTLKAALGTKLMPGTLDRWLAARAYDGQQTDETISPDRPFNLFHPVTGDWAAQGNFSRRSKKSSLQLAITTHRRLFWAGAAVLLGAAAIRFVLSGRRNAAPAAGLDSEDSEEIWPEEHQSTEDAA